MLQIRKKYKGMRWNMIYFADKRIGGEAEGRTDIVQYNHLLSEEKDIIASFPKLCECKEDITLITNLNEETDELFKKISKKERQKIRKAEREGVEIRYYDSSIERETLDMAIRLYNQFVDTKKELSFKLSYDFIKPFLEANVFYCTMAVKNEEILVMRMYYADNFRVRAWLTGSLFRINSNTNAADIGRANCLLCWKDVMYFKNAGYGCYDWGGYSEESEVSGIANFKKNFGGEIESGVNILTYGSFLGMLGLLYRKMRKK